MGLFGKKEPVRCDVCGKDSGPKHARHQAEDGTVCQSCYSKAGFPASISICLMTTDLIREQINSSDELSIVKRFKKSGGKEPKVDISAIAIKPMKKDGLLERLAAPQSKDSTAPVSCPRCSSTQISADKKGYGVVKGAVGAVVAGPIGLAAGNIGARKVRITCLKCGHQWMAGKE